MPVLYPDGPVARAERDLLLTTSGLMLIVAVPVFVLTLWFAWKYRASSKSACYRPDWASSRRIELLTWAVPGLLVIVIGVLQWDSTHKLDPYRHLHSTVAPLQIQAVALDWKWLFLYPQQGVASVNSLVLPAGVPVSIRLTSGTVMNSLYIPALGSQIYAMAGVQTRLNLLAGKPASFTGRNSQYSGAGFADQHFAVRAVTPQSFNAWIEKAKQSPLHLDAAAYAALARPGKKTPETLYASFEPGLFQRIVESYKKSPGAAAHAASLEAP